MEPDDEAAPIGAAPVAGISSATGTEGAPPDGIDNVAAFARL